MITGQVIAEEKNAATENKRERFSFLSIKSVVAQKDLSNGKYRKSVTSFHLYIIFRLFLP